MENEEKKIVREIIFNILKNLYSSLDLEAHRLAWEIKRSIDVKDETLLLSNLREASNILNPNVEWSSISVINQKISESGIEYIIPFKNFSKWNDFFEYYLKKYKEVESKDDPASWISLFYKTLFTIDALALNIKIALNFFSTLYSIANFRNNLYYNIKEAYRELKSGSYSTPELQRFSSTLIIDSYGYNNLLSSNTPLFYAVLVYPVERLLTEWPTQFYETIKFYEDDFLEKIVRKNLENPNNKYLLNRLCQPRIKSYFKERIGKYVDKITADFYSLVY